MKKNILIIVLIIILVAGGWYLWSKQKALQSQQAVVPVPNQTSDIVPTSPVEEKGGIISSIKDAMGLGKKMACTYTSSNDTKMEVSSTVFIDGQKLKTATTIGGNTTYGIFDGDTQYTWSTGPEKQGFKISKSCMEDLKNLAPKQPSETTPNGSDSIQDIQSFDNAQNVSCTEAENEDFSIPSDIVFADQCEMLRNSLKAIDTMKQKLPEGVQIPSGAQIPSNTQAPVAY